MPETDKRDVSDGKQYIKQAEEQERIYSKEPTEALTMRVPVTPEGAEHVKPADQLTGDDADEALEGVATAEEVREIQGVSRGPA